MITAQRLLFALASVVLAAIAASLFFIVVTVNGVTYLHIAQISLLVLCCLWLAWGFNMALAGIMSSGAPPRRRALPGHVSRTAILVPVYNEDAEAVLARVGAMYEGLRSIGGLDAFDFYILSDSTRAENVAAERRGVDMLLSELGAAGRLYYRNREKNVGRKAGNIADFVTTSGGAYDYMLVLDADSLMRPETMVEMVARMDGDPELGLLQTQPLIIGRRTLFGRALQFSAALFSPVFSRGIAVLQGREGPFWGHNAILRVRAFAASCGLPDLHGRPPFGGHILSHDSVEAALLARAGYKVQVDPDLEGSYEEAPANIIEYAKRDRRWCQGNLQHGKLLAAPGLKLWSRVSLASGIMAYAASPIWLMFLIVSLLDPILAPEPNYFPADSLFPVFPRPETGKALLLLFGIFVLLLLPKTLIAVGSAFTARRRRFGGTLAVLAGATAELVMTSILAPVMMMFQSKAVAEILIGADAGWPSTERADGSLPLDAAFKASWWMVLAGGLVLFATINYAPNLVLWTLPIALPLVAAPVLISATGNPALGDWVRRQRLFETPFESDPEPVIRSYALWQERLARLSAGADLEKATVSVAPVLPDPA
ncbi:glucans biosynthesis glucosyltransferase MdoH [Aurantimonas coralicida]|uniref:glucans biosynthesis glucosyltransferase MdoH n=1 Tax=Aurantimonas coralicida TaxID=182270 RepID=UPI001D197BBE|nr:glucans biosynthesis glucosyltransferase MdoH [Aurantimonas coralicida]MCC4296758.1 glucans biosynthesis glucosyltransferase MdoH [Aurantimonas coralicida]